ncbi:HNH endonuclease signature motif containing protein [Peribacillus frigoritolerans]|uniref:HNH endonuclease signature motif containing protein n=1 Tax=Peribacillus frigoritolerans TaxID=450367 RepID=A0AAJ1VB77_9BACI|nr:HNH endonuclease signature motif containing protein [Peribacillus frigoritolerans]MDM5283105.1 HNH endonuclease signature motif containing protein [Peribacillus frigoritolerans]
MTTKREVLNEIQKSNDGRFKNAVDFINEKEMIIYFMNKKFEIHEILVDIEDLLRIAKRYSSIYVNNHGYAYGVIRGTQRKERLHRFIFGYTSEGFVVDHHNGQKLDCRKSNLRELTQAENCRAYRKPTSNSGFRNVYKISSGNYTVTIQKDGHLKRFGTYPTAEAANEIAIAKRAELFGDLEGGEVLC